MADRDLTDVGIWREMDADSTGGENGQNVLEASLGAIEELEEEEDVTVEWTSTDVLEKPGSDTEGAYCHHRVPSKEVIEEHSERAGLPVFLTASALVGTDPPDWLPAAGGGILTVITLAIGYAFRTESGPTGRTEPAPAGGSS